MSPPLFLLVWRWCQTPLVVIPRVCRQITGGNAKDLFCSFYSSLVSIFLLCPILSSPQQISLSVNSYSDHHQICSPKPKKKKKKSLPEDMSSSAIPKPTHRSIPSFQSPKIHRNPNFTTTKSIQNTISENPKYSHHHDRQPLLPPRPKDFRDHLKAPLQTNTNFAETQPTKNPTTTKSSQSKPQNQQLPRTTNTQTLNPKPPLLTHEAAKPTTHSMLL